ncbi:MAG: ribosome silencing factor [Balneolaceae bacterium]
MPNRPQATSETFVSLSEDKTANADTLITSITDALLQKKAKKIVLLDVRELTSLTDYFVVCHGTSDTQIKALADHVMEETQKKIGEKVWKMEGLDARRWIILDYVNVVVHIFSEEKREFYGIERMWNDAPLREIDDN